MGLHVLRTEVDTPLLAGEVLRLACCGRSDKSRLVGVEPIDSAYVSFPNLLTPAADVVRPHETVALEKRAVGRWPQNHKAVVARRVGVVKVLCTGENVVVRRLQPQCADRVREGC